MTQHTPGPWKVQHEFDDEPSYLIGPENSNICTFEPPYQDRQADIRLIQAAPDLLAALKFLLKQSAQLSQQITHDGLENCDAIAKARQAINHAEGRP